MAVSDDPICFTLGMLRFLSDDFASTLSERGWAVADPDVVPLEWFWPPTAPVGYGGPPEWASETIRKRLHLFGPLHTPWTAPTRLTKTGTTWTLEYGKAIAKSPDVPRAYADEAELRADLERIECWPMPVDEAKTLRAESVTVAPSWQGQSLAREALHRILPDDLAWTTSRQTGQGRAFFAAVTEETGIDFPAGQPGCAHLRDGG